MKKTLTPVSVDELENELETLAPLVRDAFRLEGGPSPRVLRAIRDDAVSYLSAQKRRRRFIPLFRSLAAAATFALLLGGAIQAHYSRVELSHARDVGHLLNLGASHALTGRNESAPELAGRLLSLQGLDEEAFFFTSEEEEVLWL